MTPGPRRLAWDAPAPADALERLAPGEQWSVADVAAYLGVKPRTVTSYHARGQMPPADGYIGRSPWWRSTTIREWRKA